MNENIGDLETLIIKIIISAFTRVYHFVFKNLMQSSASFLQCEIAKIIDKVSIAFDLVWSDADRVL